MNWQTIPCAAIFRRSAFTFFRRRLQSADANPTELPVVVVGNINVGGTGKTPVIIALCHALLSAGLKPVVISRGYGAQLNHSRVLPVDAQATEFGDEPVLISRATGCPVVVGTDRVASVRLAVERQLVKRVPPDYAVDSHHWMILLGRYVCLARKPLCHRCAVSAYCDFTPKTTG